MKIKLITIILIFTTISSFGQSVSKSELKKMLKETLAKSRNYVSDATNSWFYDNTENDYETQATLTLILLEVLKEIIVKLLIGLSTTGINFDSNSLIIVMNHQLN